MFVLLFAFVFGGAIPLPGGGSYREFLMPGIFVQTLVFASITTAIAVADDMTKGLIDRFRSLPMARSAVLSGRTFADILYNTGILIVLMLTGLVVGWRMNNGFGDFVAAIALLLFFTYAMAWIGVSSASSCRPSRWPSSSASSSSSRSRSSRTRSCRRETLPGVLQPIAEWNPVSALTGATRELFGNPNPFVSGSFPGAASRLHVDRLDDRPPRDLRSARDRQVPRHRSLTRSAAWKPRAPGTIASRGSRPFVRARALPRHGPRVRRRPGRARRRGDRPRGRFPYELVAEMADLGLMGIPFPEELGGAGGDTLAYAIAIEELARIDSSVAITLAAHTSLGTMPIYLFGTEEQKQRVDPVARPRRAPRGVRAHRARRGLGRRRDAHDGDASATAPGS